MNHSKMCGHDHGAMIADFLRRFWICLALSVPLVAGSMMFQNVVGYRFTLPYSTPLLLGLATAIYGYGGWPFLSGTVGELRTRQVGMMTLVAVAISVSYGFSVAVMLGWLRGINLFLGLVTFIDIMLFGHYLKMKSVAGASHALELLVQKAAGGKVIDGAVNGEGALSVRVTHQGADSYLSKVVKMVGEAQNTKSQTQTLADRAAGWLTAVSLAGGLGTLVVWLWLGKGAACPHALGVAIPLVIAISTAISARKGLLIRNRTAFEEARRITAMMFDKTGTLTEGAFGVTRGRVLAACLDETTLLGLTAALEQQSQHPIAHGIVREAYQRKLALSAVQDFQSITGKGVSAPIDGRPVVVVSPDYLKEQRIALPPERHQQWGRNGGVRAAGWPAGGLRGFSRPPPRRFQRSGPAAAQGIKVYMATSDNQQVADAVAKELGPDGVYA